MLVREPAVRGAEREERFLGVGDRDRRVDRLAELDQRLRHDHGLERLLVREVLVERRRAHAQPVCERAHRERVEPLVLEQLAGGGDDLLRPRAELLPSAGSHRVLSRLDRLTALAEYG
jgi:hypothetical protein